MRNLLLLLVLVMLCTSVATADNSVTCAEYSHVYGRIRLDNANWYHYTIEVYNAGDSEPESELTTEGSFTGYAVYFETPTYTIAYGRMNDVDVECTVINAASQVVLHEIQYSIFSLPNPGTYVEFPGTKDGSPEGVQICAEPLSLDESTWASIKATF